MTSNTTGPRSAPPPGGGAGFGVVAADLARLLPVFEQLKEDADAYGRTVEDHASVSGDQTGATVCPQAGDALRTALQQVVDNLQAFGTHALDLHGAVRAAVAHYEDTDEAGGQQHVVAAGGDR